MSNRLSTLLSGRSALGRATILTSAAAITATLLATAPAPSSAKEPSTTQSTETLPFPKDPGAFLAAALKKLYGTTIRLKWHADSLGLVESGLRTNSPADGTLTL